MSDEIKFTQKELDSIKTFQQRYIDIQMGFGQVEITKMRIATQQANADTFSNNLHEQYNTVQTEEKEFIEKINEKYGDGVLDPDTGVFTPNTTQNTWKNN